MPSDQFTQKVVLELVDKASDSLNSAKRAMGELGDAAQKSEQQANKSLGVWGKFTDFLAKRFVFTIDNVIQGLQKLGKTIDDSLNLAGQEQALANQLASIGQNFDEFLAKLDQVAQGTVSTADLISASSRALLLGIPATEISDLLEVAAARALATGQTTAKAFEDITTGIGRLSPLILDNLGFVIRLEDAYEKHALAVGKSTTALTGMEQRQAVVNEILDQGAGSAGDFAENIDKSTLSIRQGQAAWGNFKTSVTELTAALGAGLGAIIVKTARGFVFLTEKVVDFNQVMVDLGKNIPGVGDSFDGIADKLREWDESLEKSGAELKQYEDSLAGFAEQMFKSALGFEEITGKATAAAFSIETYNAAGRQSSEVQEDLNKGLDDTVTLLPELTARTEAQTAAITRQGQATALAATQAERLAASSGLGAQRGVIARSSRSQADVDLALYVGRQTYLGGTRIKTADGSGSRLVGRR